MYVKVFIQSRMPMSHDASAVQVERICCKIIITDRWSKHLASRRPCGHLTLTRWHVLYSSIYMSYLFINDPIRVYKRNKNQKPIRRVAIKRVIHNVNIFVSSQNKRLCSNETQNV